MVDRFQVVVQRQAEKQLRRLPRQVLGRVFVAVKGLADNPRPSGCKKLRGHDCAYRLHIGDYRVIYDVDDNSRTVVVWRIRHRQSAYQRLK